MDGPDPTPLMTKDQKHGLPVIDAEQYNSAPDRYELRKGDAAGAPPCPYGNDYKWIAFDKKKQVYVRVTKSVFKRMLTSRDLRE